MYGLQNDVLSTPFVCCDLFTASVVCGPYIPGPVAICCDVKKPCDNKNCCSFNTSFPVCPGCRLVVGYEDDLNCTPDVGVIPEEVVSFEFVGYMVLIINYMAIK